MIHLINKIIGSTINNLVGSLFFLSIALFYTLTVLQLPIPDIFHMFGILVLFTLGLNAVLFTDHPVQA